MSEINRQAESAVKKLLLSDENQLYEHLGIRSKAIALDPSISSSFEPQVTYDEVQMGLLDDVRNLGMRIFRRLSVEAYKLLCGTDAENKKEREKLAEAFGISSTAAATTLATLLVTQLGLAPAIAAVIASLIVKRFFNKAYNKFCQKWKKKLPKEEP